MVKSADIRAVAPALEGYAQKFVDGLVACDMPRRQPDQQEDRVGPARGWPGGPPRRRGMVSSEPKTLAWRFPDDGDDPHRCLGVRRRQERR